MAAQVPNSTPTHTPPRARGIPFLGILPQFWQSPLTALLRLAQEYGPVVQLDLGPRRFYLVSRPEEIKYILQDNNKNYEKGYERIKPLLGEGLVTADGERWLRQRRIMQPLFGRNALLDLLPYMVDATQETVTAWNARPTGARTLDIAHEMMMLTQTIILRTMFSTGLGNRSQEIAEAFSVTLEYMNGALFSPFPTNDRLPTPSNLRFRKALPVLEGVIYSLLDERRKNPPTRSDLLTALLSARFENGEGMSEKQIRDEVMTIFLAGHETTATLLAWTFYLLGLHPEIEKEVRREFGKVPDEKAGLETRLDGMVYTRQVLDEVLRLYPPAWMFARRSIGADQVGGFDIPARSMIFISPYVTHHLPALWDEPERFDPQRFNPTRSAGRAKFAYFPFGGGPRQCLGNTFALLEAPLILSTLMSALRFKLVPGQTIKAAPQATLRPKSAIWMEFEPV